MVNKSTYLSQIYSGNQNKFLRALKRCHCYLLPFNGVCYNNMEVCLGCTATIPLRCKSLGEKGAIDPDERPECELLHHNHLG